MANKGAHYFGKVITDKQPPNDIMVSQDLAKHSNLMVNGIVNGQDEVLTSMKNLSLKEKISNGVSNSMSIDLSIKPDSFSSPLSRECEKFSQETILYVNPNQEDCVISCEERARSSNNDKKPNLVTSCDSSKILTNLNTSNVANSANLLHDISGHKEISQDTGSEELIDSTSNKSLAKNNENFCEGSSESSCVVEESNAILEHKSLSEPTKGANITQSDVTYIVYESELNMPDIIRLIQKDLSEPYSIYTYRYFIHNWPHLCFMARVGDECVGAIVCKLDYHKKIVKRGYIAMLAVDSGHRKRKIGSTLVKRAIDAMIAEDADEVVLETVITNKPALRLYENLGFVRDKRLFRYYLNGVDALRLKLWLR